MTQLILEIPTRSDLDILLPLLKRLKIRFTATESSDAPDDIAQAIRIIQQGCDMSSFGDPLVYQQETRIDRPQPFRD